MVVYGLFTAIAIWVISDEKYVFDVKHHWTGCAGVPCKIPRADDHRLALAGTSRPPFGRALRPTRTGADSLAPPLSTRGQLIAPRPAMRLHRRFIYAVEMGFYAFSIPHLLLFETKRKDFFVMVMHHLVTLLLIAFSLSFNFMRIGVPVMALHDVCDIFLEGAKAFKYTSRVRQPSQARASS